jgi:hypothetical protein
MFFIVFVLMVMTAQNAPSRSSDPVVTVSGCVRGNHLKLPIDTTAAVEYPLRASEYVLEGSKELLRLMRKDHDGHHEEVTGTLKVPPGKASDVHIQQKDLGPKTRVTVGVREAAGESAPAPVRLVVSSFRHVADHCDQR